jgi:hypothetical protein
MKSFLYKATAMLGLCMGVAGYAGAQTPATTHAGEFDAGGTTEYSQYLYVAPGAHITIAAGTQWIIASQYVFIAPTAVIDGGGQMVFDDPGNFGIEQEKTAWAGQPTTVDGGNSQILARVVNRNPNNIVLGAVSIAASDGDITVANTDHTLYIGTSFDYGLTHADGSAITSNDVLLGNNDFRFSTAATQTDYSSSRFAVTNGQGHVVKDSYTGSWAFPVGMAEGDYTPATVTPGSANTIHVNVTNYDNDGLLQQSGADGMDRSWNIYGNSSTGATITLQHNSSSDGASWMKAANFVTRYGTNPNLTGDKTSGVGSPWQSNTPQASTTAGGAGTETNSRSYTSLALTPTANEAWYSKASDVVNPLPLRLIGFTANKQLGSSTNTAILNWTVAEQVNTQSFVVERSTDGVNFTAIATKAAAGSFAGEITYAYTDANAQAGINYYRLKMVDIDGSATRSPVKTVNFDAAATASMYLAPNPTRGQFYVKGFAGKALVRVVDMRGRVVLEQTAVDQ